MKLFMYIMLIFVAILIFYMSTFLFSVKERFQEYIYIPPQSIISSHDDSHSMPHTHAMMMMNSLYGMNSQLPQLPLPNFNNFGFNYSSQPRQYNRPRTTPKVTTNPPPETTRETTPATTPNTNSTIVPNTPSDHGTAHVPGVTDPGALPVFSIMSSLHQDGTTDGELINPSKLDPIFAILKFPSVADMITRLDKLGAFNQGQTAEQKKGATYIVLAMLGKLKTLPASKFDTVCKGWTVKDSDDSRCATAGKAYGLMKYHSLRREWEKVEEQIKKYGGSTHSLTDQQMMTLWSTNEHHNLHCCLDPNKYIGTAVHMTSLNNRSHLKTSFCANKSTCTNSEVLNREKDLICDWPKTRTDDDAGDGSLCKTGWSGGYNDTGRHHQWNWFKSAREVEDEFKKELSLQ